MDDWRSPKARFKETLKQIVFRIFGALGRFRPVPPADLKTRGQNTVPFFGHRVQGPRVLAQHKETRQAFQTPREPYEQVQDLMYSETGMTWVSGCLIEAYSVQPVRLSDIVSSPPSSPGHTMDTCAVVECDYVYSYGDWVHCYLGTLLSQSYPDVPVLIPAYLARKGYVQRDLARAGVSWIAASGWTHIKTAYVLRKPNPKFYWSPQDVAAFRARFVPNPGVPKTGSVTYLGRFDLAGETITRAFPSEKTAEYVTSIGGRVIRQADLTTQTAASFGEAAETVIGDHGSGLLNIMFWQPKTVIELVVGDWWVNNTLFVAAGMGIENFAVLCVDDLSAEEIGQKITACLDYFDQRSDTAL